MQTSSSIRTWGKRIFLAAILLAICGGGAIVLAQFGVFTPIETFLILLVLGGGGILAYRQHGISKQLKQLNTQSWDLAEFEKGISHQLQRTTVQANETARQNAAQFDDYTVSVSEQLGTLGKRLTKLENSATIKAEPTAGPIDEKKSASTDAKPKPTTKSNAAKTSAIKKDTRLASALKEDTLRVHLQPIVELPSRNPVYFETSMQLNLENKEVMDPAEFEELANAGGIKPALDTKMLFSSVRMLRTLKSLKKTSGVFCQLSRASLAQAKSFATILEFLQANETIKKSLVLEISQKDFDTLNRKELARFDSIADLGFPLALGQVQKLDIPVESIAAYGFKFVKIPMETILQASIEEDQNGFQAMPIANALRQHNVSVIASQVTQETQAITLIDMSVPYSQGTLFAPPRPVKAELLGS